MKKSLIDKLRDESSSEHVAYTEFITSYKKKSEILYCFFEGKEDKRYYNFRIEHITLKKHQSFTCNGKDRVIAVYNLIRQKREYSDAKILYFIDKDFDFKKLQINDIYRTPYYSIENFYCGQRAIEKIIQSEFELVKNDEDYNKILYIFKKLQSKFHKEILFFNSWLSCQHDIRNRSKTKTYLLIDDSVDKYFRKIVKDNLNEITDFTDINNQDLIENILFPKAPKISKKILIKKIKRFRKINAYKYFRGKFEIKFIISFLFALQSEIGKKNSKIFSKRYSCNLRFENSTSISLLTQYSETPKNLVTYLSAYKKAI